MDEEMKHEDADSHDHSQNDQMKSSPSVPSANSDSLQDRLLQNDDVPAENMPVIEEISTQAGQPEAKRKADSIPTVGMYCNPGYPSQF